jgi:hypothetical protein
MLKKNKGVALIAALVLLIAITGLVLALHYLGRVCVADTVSLTNKMETYYLAETGLDDAIFYMLNGCPKYYDDGRVAYRIDTPRTTDATFIGPDYRVFNNGETINFLIWSGELDAAAATGTVWISDGTSTENFSLSRSVDLDGNIGNGCEGFTFDYSLPSTVLNNSVPWSVTLLLEDGTNTYSVSGIVLQINGVGTPSESGWRKIKCTAYFPWRDNNYLVKTILVAEGAVLSVTPSCTLKEIEE